MRTFIAINGEETQVLFAPENETDKTAIGLIQSLPQMSLVRRKIKSKNTSVKCGCLLVRLEGEHPTLFQEEVGDGVQ